MPNSDPKLRSEDLANIPAWVTVQCELFPSDPTMCVILQTILTLLWARLLLGVGGWHRQKGHLTLEGRSLPMKRLFPLQLDVIVSFPLITL